MHNETKSMTSGEVCRALKLSRSQVTRKAANGELPVVEKAPGKRGAYFFDREAIEDMAGASC
ncbi:MAG: hypothetical protein AMXMBFR58_37370 [Phycisphaerae bacterium]